MIKILFTTVVYLLFSIVITAQSVGINNNTPDASAILDVKSNTKGILVPRTSTASRIAIINPAKGLMLYDTTTNSFWFYNSTLWTQITVGNNGWNLTGNTGINPTTQFIGTIDAQPLRFRVNNNWAGEINPNSYNLFLGMGAGQSNTTGQANTAIGEHALSANTDGTFNVASGYYSLAVNSTGYSNTATGAYSLSSNTIGLKNTGFGRNALYANTTGSSNTAVGADALLTNTTGFNNTASGYQSLYSNTTAIANVATGSYAMYSNTTGDQNIAMGEVALYSNTTGSHNTALGQGALHGNNSGSDNTATGLKSLYLNSTGYSNTANGYEAMYSNTTGHENTAFGYEALYFNNTGTANTATGFAALGLNTNGANNTANGYLAMFSNTAGAYNTAMGDHALYGNGGGLANTAVGMYALSSNSYGSNNSAFGYNAANSNTSGNSNTSIGQFSLSATTTGTGNTGLGAYALANNITGSNNIAIGGFTGVAVGSGNLSNTIGIGNDGGFLNQAPNQVVIGNASMVFIGGKVNWGVVSDERIKNNIKEDVKGLDFILRLRPVTYHISNEAINRVTNTVDTTYFAGKYDGEKITYTGFLAQEVEKAAIASGYNFSGYSKPQNAQQLYTIRYAEFVVPLVKAMQEQQAVIDPMKNEIHLLKDQVQSLITRVQQLNAIVEKQK